MSIFERYKRNKREADHEEVIRTSQYIYQIKEHNGELWLTYDRNLVCPCSMLNMEPVDAIQEMRKLYIERTPKITRI